MASGVAIFPLSNSVAFSPAVNNGLTVLRQDNYKNNIQDWQTNLPYNQPVLNTDNLTIMARVGFPSAVPALYICDHNKVPVVGIDLSVVPYFKGFFVAGTFTFPSGGMQDLTNVMWSFSFNDFVSEIPAGGIFYLRMDYALTGGGTNSYYSEPMLVSNTHPDTQQYQFSYNTNNAAKNIIVSVPLRLVCIPGNSVAVPLKSIWYIFLKVKTPVSLPSHKARKYPPIR